MKTKNYNFSKNKKEIRMAFSLNKSKDVKTTSSVPLWKVEHILGNEFVTILLDEPLLIDQNNIDKEILGFLEKILQKAGILSYVITSALRKKPIEKAGNGKTEYYVENDSGWFQEIILKARNEGKVANVVIPFGAALYQITKTGTDFTVEDLIYPAFENYVYIGHGWIGDYDCFLFPQFPIYDVFCPGTRNAVELSSWKMNFMVTVFKKIAAKQYQLPDDMTTPDLIEIGAKYDEDKIAAVKETEEFLNKHFNSDICSFDLETSGFSAWKDKIRCITLSFDPSAGYYIEWKIFKENPQLVDLLSKMMLTCKHRVTVNGKFDIKFLWVNGLSTDVTVTEDAMTMCHALCSGRKKGLKTQTYFWTPHGGYDHALDVYRDNLKKKGIKDPSYYDIPKSTLFTYATMDAVMTTRVWLAGMKRVHKFDTEYPTEKPIEHTGGHAYTVWEWYQFIMKIYPIICKMEYEGLHVDEHVIELHRKIFQRQIDEAKAALAKTFNVSPDFDFNSATKLGKLLEENGWPCHGRNQAGVYETGSTAFREWERDNQKGLSDIIKYRKACKCLTTYLGMEEVTVNQRTGAVTKEWSGWPQFIIHHPDGSSRIHCDFGVCATETFRMISKEPNLQNVPTHSNQGSITKMCFSCPPAPMIFITDENGKEWKVTQLGVINTNRGYVAALAVNENDSIVDIGEKTVLEWEEWCAENIDPIGIETMWKKLTVEVGADTVIEKVGKIKIKVDVYNKEAGKRDYLLMTQDAASLEARVATADTALNASGIDKTLYSVYAPKTGLGDLHSQTAFNTFCGSIDMQINEAVDDSGKTWLFIDTQKLTVERDGKEMVVTGAEVLETDKIKDYYND